MKKVHRRGRTVVKALILVLVLALLGSAGWYAYKGHTSVATVHPMKHTASAKASTAYFTLSQWNVRAPYAGNLTLTVQSIDSRHAVLSSKQLLDNADKAECISSDSGNFVIQRYSSGEYVTDDRMNDTSSALTAAQAYATSSLNIVKVGDYYYLYQLNKSPCAASVYDGIPQFAQTDVAVKSIVAHLEMVSANPYAGWKTYSSSTEKLTFMYPADWTATLSADSTQVEGADSLNLKSPLSAFSVQWYSSVEGIGGACSKYILPGTTPASGDLSPCPYFSVLDKQKLAGADLYYVDGVVERSDGKAYSAWCGLQDSSGIVQDESNIGYMVFKAKNTFVGTNNANRGGPYQAELACANGFGSGTKAEATAFLAAPEMQQAKLILLSASY